MTIDNAVNNYLISSKATKSLKTYVWEEKTFKSFYSFCLKHQVLNLKKLNQVVLLDYIGYEKQRNLSNVTLNNKIKLVRRMIRYNDPSIDISKISLLREKKHTVDRLSDDEIQFLFKYLNSLDQESINNYVYKTIYYFLFDTGVRIDEALNIKIEDIDLNKRIIHLKVTKFSKERFIDFSTRLLPMIKKCIDLSEGSYLFWNKLKHRRIEYANDIAYFYIKIRKDTGHQKLTAHRIRHTFASISAQNGMNILSLKEILGHDNLKTTQKYLHANRKKTKSDYDKFSFFNNNDLKI